jgi:hypothetical protein
MATAGNIKDVLDSRREFSIVVGDEEISYYIAQPSAADIRKSDWQYSKVYNKAIVDGFLTQAQMVDLLKDKGILSDDYAEKVETVRISLAAELFKLEHMEETSPELERESVALEVARLRDELFALNQQVNGPMGNTCENLAEDARTEHLTYRIVQTKDGSRLWEDFESFQSEENSTLVVKARFEVMLWIQGLESNFMETTPEQTALRAIAQSRLDKALEDARGDSEDAPGEDEVVESEELVDKPKAKRKRAPRKKAASKKAAPKKRGRPKKKVEPKAASEKESDPQED